MDHVGAPDPTAALRKLFDHLMAPGTIAAGDRIDVVRVLLDTWDQLRRDEDGAALAADWARERAGRGFAAVPLPDFGDAAEVPSIGQEAAVPPDLLDVLVWDLLVEPDQAGFDAGYRAAWIVAYGCREWTSEVDALAGHLLLVHDLDARSRRQPGDEPFDLLERLWAVHLPVADLDNCLGRDVERELASD